MKRQVCKITAKRVKTRARVLEQVARGAYLLLLLKSSLAVNATCHHHQPLAKSSPQPTDPSLKGEEDAGGALSSPPTVPCIVSSPDLAFHEAESGIRTRIRDQSFGEKKRVTKYIPGSRLTCHKGKILVCPSLSGR